MCRQPLEPASEPLDSTLYNVLLTDEYGCVAFDEAWVFVDKQRYIFIPNVFSPNEDGINDVFFISGTSIAQIKRFQVFDRWGGLIYTRQNFEIESGASLWNGYSSNKIVDNGVYSFRLQVKLINNTK